MKSPWNKFFCLFLLLSSIFPGLAEYKDKESEDSHPPSQSHPTHPSSSPDDSTLNDNIDDSSDVTDDSKHNLDTSSDTTSYDNKEILEETTEPEKAKFNQGVELISKLSFEDKSKGYELLKEAVTAGNTKAQALIAYGYIYGNVLERNFTKAYELFSELSQRGIPSGQQGLGFMYSMGIGVNSSQPKAILYYTFGALGGNVHAQMAMGYRFLHGVSTSQNCESALSYYKKVAKIVVDESSLFAGGHAVQKVRLTEEDEANVFAGVTEDEVDHYREVFADSGAQLSLGLYYLLGLGGVERNLPQALELLKRADSPTAYALIGRIYAEGNPPNIQQSNETAIKYFKRAIEHKTPEGYTGLGIMYFKGMGVQQDYIRALEYFQKGAERGSHEAHLYIGMSYLYGFGKPPNPTKALHSMKLAAQGGHLLALYHLAEIYAKGLAGRRNCNQAVDLYKAVAERGKWSRLQREAHRLYLSGDVDSSLMMYLHLGELGIEVAQCNAAYILEEGHNTLLNHTEVLKRALLLWSRSATQGYGIARVKLGDYYYYGKGTEQDLYLAAEQYRLASDRMSSPQAMFNLGYMYENGLGLHQDYHLAKRYYDLAAETSPEALVPITLALVKLNVVFYYHTVINKFESNEKLMSLVNTLDVTLGDQWDIYLIALLCVILAIVIRWYRR